MGAILSLGSPGAGTGLARPAQMAEAIHPVFLVGIGVMAVAAVLVHLIPELPLRRSVREHAEPSPATA